MNYRVLAGLLLTFGITSTCMAQTTTTYSFDLQGHRGARGLAPENTMAAFMKALDYPITTLELDVVITKDKQVIVSHEPWLNPAICLDPKGNPISSDQPKQWNIYEMTLEEVQACDCGSKGNPGFPEQRAEPAVKPLLSSMFEIIEREVQSQDRAPVFYNIEIKSTLEDEEEGYQPSVEEFTALVFQAFEASGVESDRILMQSFDFRVLKHWKDKYSKYPMAALVANSKTWQENLADLGFIPEVYSPYYKMLNPGVVQQIQDAGMKVIPWTVNTTDEMRQLLEWGVDGIITDYPDRAVSLKK
jgi:glycerophosphoryl diester phosphodiesterase